MADNVNLPGVKSAKDFVEAAYPDAMQPAAREFGEAAKPAGRELGDSVSVLARTVSAALDPLRAVLWGYEQIRELICEQVASRFEKKPERLGEANLAVVGPAVEALRFTASDPTLRELYMNLLATSMDKENARQAHPAFVETVKQLTPDEARIVRLLGTESFELETRWEVKPTGDELWDQLRTKVAVPAGCECPDLLPSYPDNLKRLGLVDFPITRLMETSSGHMTRAKLHLTHFGRQFCDACVVQPSPPTANPSAGTDASA
jgi:hypothetical protein